MRRLNCTELETGQRRKAPSPHLLSLSIPSSMVTPEDEKYEVHPRIMKIE
jgi:hypothetical protein